MNPDFLTFVWNKQQASMFCTRPCDPQLRCCVQAGYSKSTGPTFSVHHPPVTLGGTRAGGRLGWRRGSEEREGVGMGNGKDRRRNPRHCSVFIGLSSAVRISWRFCPLPADAVLTCLATAGVARSYRDVHPKRFWPLPSSWWHGLQAGLTAMCLHWNRQYVAFLHTCKNYA